MIYVDNASTTPISEIALKAMLPILQNNFGNPSNVYTLGRSTKILLENSRKTIADCLGVDSNEIFFTSGGSESNNWAIKGITFELQKKGKNHVITSNIEHHSVLNVVESLKKQGFEISIIPVEKNGIIDPKNVENAITEKTALISIMLANNEIGTIQPIQEIGRICEKHNVIFHSDAVQAVGHIPVDIAQNNLSLLSFSAHKFHGPKGIGALYIKKGVRIQKLIEGGAQENNRRAGTENVAYAVGMAESLKESCETLCDKTIRLTKLRDKLIENLLKIECSRLNGDAEKRLANNVNMCFEGIEGESLLLMLDALGICASSGSACTSGSLDPSHVLLALGLPHEIAHGSLRLSLSRFNTEEEIDYIIEKIPQVVKKLRKMSPLWEKILCNINKKEKS